MPRIRSNGIELHYEEYGSRRNPTLMLICGWSVQLTFWPPEFINRLVKAGYHVLVYDNRDTGLSQKIRHRPATLPFAPHIMAARFLKAKKLAAYTLVDMADDAAGLLDALDIPRAHILGLSMGGMIAQIFGARHAEKVKSLTIMMSSTARLGVPMVSYDLAFDIFLRPRSRNRKKARENSLQLWRQIRTQDGGYDDSKFNEHIDATIDRSYYPAGRKRQAEAIFATGDIRPYSRQITAPTLVIHGSADRMAPPQCGVDVAANIPGARFELIDGMGHDIPPNRVDLLAGMITGHLNVTAGRRPKLRVA